jgi:mono/diheme cytochrome c family protein
MRHSFVVSGLLIIAGMILIACGTVASEPRPTFEPTNTFDFSARNSVQETRVAQAEADRAVEEDTITVAQDQDSDGSAETDTVTEAATATTVPATASPVPATPTVAPTVAEPTEAPAAEQTIHERFPDLPANADPTIGDTLFNLVAMSPSTGQNCTACHNPNEPVPGTGPYVYGIANVAAERVGGQTAVEYLYNSIAHPNDYILEQQGDMMYAANVMPSDWTEVLTDDDIYHIVAYLLTLDQEG